MTRAARPPARARVARDIMHRAVLTVRPEMTLQDLAKFFIDSNISGAPVVDAEERLIGVISQTDLVRHERDWTPHLAEAPGYYKDSDGPFVLRGFQIEAPDTACVRDVMTPAVYMTEDTTPLEEVVRFMLSKHVHRIIVTRHGKLAGIISTMDLLQALLRSRTFVRELRRGPSEANGRKHRSRRRTLPPAAPAA